MATALKAESYAYLYGTYTPDTIIRQLPARPYRRVVGLDLGVSKALLWEYRQQGDGLWASAPAALGEVPMVLSYDSGAPRIGRTVVNDTGVLSHFFQSPDYWPQLLTRQRSVGEVFRDYLRLLWQQAESADPGLARDREEGELLLVAGCPLSPAWLEEKNRGAFVRALREATGCPFVTVIPDALATLMGSGLELRQGAALYELGAGSVRFTYMAPGQRLISRRLRWGGNAVDKRLTETFLARHGLNGSLPRSVQAQCRELLREEKEGFFSGGALPRPARTLPLAQGQSLTLQLDEGLLAQALEPEDGEGWGAQLRAFVRETRALIGEEDCGSVLLSGGGCPMPQLWQAVSGAYPGVRAACAARPAAAVARGLGEILSREIGAVGAVSQLQQSVENMMKYQTKQILPQLGELISRRMWNLMRFKILKQRERQMGCAASELIAAVEEAFSKSAEDPRMLRSWQEIMAEVMKGGALRAEYDLRPLSGELFDLPIPEVPESLWRGQVLPEFPAVLPKGYPLDYTLKRLAVEYSDENVRVDEKFNETSESDVKDLLHTAIHLPGMLYSCFAREAQARRADFFITPEQLRRMAEHLSDERRWSAVEPDINKIFEHDSELGTALSDAAQRVLELSLGLILGLVYQKIEI